VKQKKSFFWFHKREERGENKWESVGGGMQLQSVMAIFDESKGKEEKEGD